MCYQTACNAYLQSCYSTQPYAGLAAAEGGRKCQRSETCLPGALLAAMTSCAVILSDLNNGKPKAGRLLSGSAIGRMWKGKCGDLISGNPA
jgi:hypothetical protein